MEIAGYHMELMMAQHGECFYCGNPMWFDKNKGRNRGYTIDHFVAKKYKMGKVLKFNHVLAHKKCNTEKADRLPSVEETVRFYELVKKLENRRKTLKQIQSV